MTGGGETWTRLKTFKKNMLEQTIQIMRHEKGKKSGENRILASYIAIDC
jgi:hypothetical protein